MLIFANKKYVLFNCLLSEKITTNRFIALKFSAYSKKIPKIFKISKID